MTLERLAVLREALKAQEAADEQKKQARGGEGSDAGALKGEESEPETKDEEGKDDNERDSWKKWTRKKLGTLEQR